MSAALEVDGIDVFVEGEGGESIVMIHGWPDTYRLWDAQADFLRDRYRCVRFTLPERYVGKLHLGDMLTLSVPDAAELKHPAKIVILNNDFLGMVKQWQDLFYEKRYSGTPMKNPNFKLLAESMGVKGIRCDDKTKIASAVAEMLAHPGPVVADFYVEPSEHVYPMVPAGKGLHEMELGTLA